MQPFVTVTVTRPWHWGIVIVSDPELGGQIPEVEPDLRVTANRNGLVIVVRHAQDDVPSFDGDVTWSEAAVTVRHYRDRPETVAGSTVIFEGEIATPSGRLWIGDADEDVEMSGLESTSVLRVLTPLDEPESPSHIEIDIWSR